MTTTEDYQQTPSDLGAAEPLGSRDAAPRRRRTRTEPGVLDNPFTAQLVADEIRAWAEHLDQSGEHLPSRTAMLRQAALEIEGRN